MTCKVVLNVESGALPQRGYVFEGPAECVIGRGDDCPLQVPAMEVSRHHCLLEIDPPKVRIRDLGSFNGTFVNGMMIGRRDRSQPPEGRPTRTLPAVELLPGDEVKVGATVFQVAVIDGDQQADSAAGS
jgi:pSer/pThr/pTyr-binding forkhead associated (FHA) protein